MMGDRPVKLNEEAFAQIKTLCGSILVAGEGAR